MNKVLDYFIGIKNDEHKTYPIAITRLIHKKYE